MPTGKERFAALASEVAREIMRRRSSDACCGDLTLEQFETIQAVARAERPTVGALSAALQVDMSTMSRNVSVLEKGGYLRRTRNAGDGRIVHVELTSVGRAALATLRCGERDVLGDVYARHPPGERAMVLKALDSLRSPVTAAAPAPACCAPVAV